MHKDKLQEILEKYKKGICSDEELRLLERWLIELDDVTKEEAVFSDSDEAKEVYDLMREGIHRRIQQVRPKYQKLWMPYLKIAAIILVFIFVGYYFLPKNRISNEQVAQLDITRWDTISTAQGQVKKVRLGDSSLVYLSTGSEIRIASGFSRKHRRLELLSGEAWFDVVKNPHLPFIVKSGDLETVVLGTQFTVSAYQGLNTVGVHVNRGRVKVQTAQKAHQELTAVQSVKYNLKDNSLQVKETLPVIFDPENQRYLLNGCSFDELAMRIENIFGYKLIPTKPSIKKRHYTGEIQLKGNIRSVIGKFSEIHHSEFYIDGKEVYMQ